MTNQQITIATTIAAPIERVWEAYTTPADITRWNFASDDWCCPSAEADLKVGGAYKARMEAKDGSVGFDFEAVYEEVEPYKAITLAMSDGRRARTTFEVVDPIEAYAHANPASAIAQIHVFPFGGIKAAATWLIERGTWARRGD
ncbi:SRPBCC domain-containing protein [Chelativorans xinjiangense]|uniref:SRPBCC domain-containing protein n=1 Tax=Chelativorans xinjiangense TaxID=2681485 RepID=UPI0013577910|nr:SRPBCC domain-containing protein [Chelativorans xinjiangense]